MSPEDNEAAVGERLHRRGWRKATPARSFEQWVAENAAAFR
ncbi:hypothetical protein AB0F92_30395 [Kitasatospora aureofaciens]